MVLFMGISLFLQVPFLAVPRCRSNACDGSMFRSLPTLAAANRPLRNAGSGLASSRSLMVGSAAVRNPP
jgi:hypothetical protein